MSERYPGKPAGKKTQPKTKRPNHIITVILGVVFVLLAVGVPAALIYLGSGDDLDVLSQPLESNAAVTDFERAAPATRATATEVINEDCRSYVYQRCNALRIEPRECVKLAAEAIHVDPEGGAPLCRERMDPMVADVARFAEAAMQHAAAAAEVGAETERLALGQVAEVDDGSLVALGQGSNDEARVDPSQPGQPTQDDAGRQAENGQPAAEGQAAVAGGTEEKPEEEAQTETAASKPEKKQLTVQEKARALTRMHQVLEEFQRAAYNYGQPTGPQVARIQELKELAEKLDTDEARELYNHLVKTYQTPEIIQPRINPMLDPSTIETVGESQRIEAGVTDRSPTTSPEMDKVRGWMDEARKEAGLPAAPAAAQPDQVAQPTATVESASISSEIGSVSPSSVGQVTSINP
jgi:hypothetical protein